MPTGSITVQVTPKIRRKWALRLAVWLLGLVRVDVEANGKRLGTSARLSGTIGVESE